MIIGLDFDNTIVSYDALFHKVALEKKLITKNMPINKVCIRDHLRKIGQEALWTELQGYVYGARMNEAASYPGVIEFLRWAVDLKYSVNIISHKTLYPFVGPRYDLHKATREWVNTQLRDNNNVLIRQENIFLEPTKEKKINRISVLNCDIFLDDLPEILLAHNFPKKTRRALFDPENNHGEFYGNSLNIIHNWSIFKNILAQ